VAAGVLTIGEEHGGAGMRCMELLARGLELSRNESLSLEQAAERLVAQARTSGERLPGFGHRVHATFDPRVFVLFGLAEDAGLAGDGVRFARALETALKKRVKPIPLNIDGALAAILHDLGFPPLLGMLLFIISRVAGISAEVAEEYDREKPMRIRIPVVYDGPDAERKSEE
jgi:citrate synthase